MKRWSVYLWLILTLIILSGCELNRPAPEETEIPVVTPSEESNDGNDNQNDNQNVLDDTSRALTNPLGSPLVVRGQAIVKFTEDVLPQLPKNRDESFGTFSVGDPTLNESFSELGINGMEPVLASVAVASGQGFETLSADAGPGDQFYVVTFDGEKDPQEISSALTQNPKVLYAEPNYVAMASGEPANIPPQFVPNDEFYIHQWNMEAIQMPQAWDVSNGAGVVVAILDTGVAYETYDQYEQAPDLAQTIFVPGYDFINTDDHPNDDQGHGTHVAGTIAQSTNNGLGVAGVAFGASVMPIKVLDSAGRGSYATIIQGIYYAVENGASVINMSLSGHNGSQALEEALAQARSQGVLVIAAAGNSGGAVEYPARYNTTLAVGAVRFDRNQADYSNYGPELDLVAPGGDNTVDQNNDGFNDGIVQQTFKQGEINQFRFLFFEGTSMATPHVSGVAALLLAKSPGLTPDDLTNILKSTALDLGPAGQDNEYGAGLLQAATALDTVVVGQPTNTPTLVPVTMTPTPLIPTQEAPTPILPGDTPTPTPVVPDPTFTPTPGVPTVLVGDIILNGGFETDDVWVYKPTEFRGRYTTDRFRTGARSAVVGIVDPAADRYAFSSVAQSVTIAPDIRKATLSAFIYRVSQDISSGDGQLILILDQNFNEIERLSRSLTNDTDWQQVNFDLSHYAGQTIYVYFGVVNTTNNGLTTYMYIDDITLITER